MPSDQPDPPPDPAPDATWLIARLEDGDQAAAEQLLPLIYSELHRLAASIMRTERGNHTLQPTALVHEAYLRLMKSEPGTPAPGDRRHFLRLAARSMRNVLVDHARQRSSEKRGGGNAQVTLHDDAAFRTPDAESLLRVDETLQRLTDVDAQLGQIVELRFFAGLDNEEIAAVLGVSARTVQRSWRTARAWLLKEMEGDA